MEINNMNDKIALIRLAECVVTEMKKSKTTDEIHCFMKDSFGFSDELLDQIL